MRLASRLGHERLIRIDRLRRRNPLVGALLAPLRWWLRRGWIRVIGGAGEGLRLSLAHMSATHAHAGALPRGWLEVSVQEAMRRLLGPGDVFFDVGANIGFFTLIGARLVEPGGRAIAFEPVPANVEAIRANAALNGIDNVDVLEKAAGAERRHDRLLLVEDLSWSHLESRGWHPQTTEAVDIEVVTIDELVGSGEVPPPALVKIDVEGSEGDVLAGMRDTIERHRPAIVCELHGTNREFVEAMESVGYEASNLEAKADVLDSAPNAHALGLPRV
jgi:FkbM family methyltransferase